jgi:hypothetical protein
MKQIVQVDKALRAVTSLASFLSVSPSEGLDHGLINYIDTKTKCKCCHLKRFTRKGTLRQVFICLINSSPLPVTHCIRTGHVFIHTGKEGRGGERPKEKV